LILSCYVKLHTCVTLDLMFGMVDAATIKLRIRSNKCSPVHVETVGPDFVDNQLGNLS